MFGLVPREARTTRCSDGQLLAKLMDIFFLIKKKKSLLKTSMACQRKDNFHSQKFVIFLSKSE